MPRHHRLRNLAFAPLLLAAGLFVLFAAIPAHAQQSDLQGLLQELQEARNQERQQAQQRINEFINKVEQREQMLEEAVAARDAARARRDRLQKTFDENENKLTELNEELQARKGEFGEVFGVIRQTAGDARSTMRGSLTASQDPERAQSLAKLAESKALPSIDQIDHLWRTLLEEMVATGEIARYSAEIVRPNGEREQAEVMRVGPFTAFIGDQFLNFEASTQELSVLPRQPAGRWQSMAQNLYNADAAQASLAAPVDPSRGAILSRLIQKPTLMERVQQGGLVGYVVIAVGLIGLLISLERFFTLGRIERRMRRQRKDPENPSDDNPLGEVLQAYQDNKDTDTETLQLKLDEAILRRLPRLERGLATVRILSAVAPMLGLLGTVVGMIATFQAITLFGTGDPKLMAGGISQALVTTSLGLITAVPLILLHSMLNGRSRRLIQTLEHQASGIVASHAEEQTQAHV
ncbi:MAG: MotA/TolQ/ExbB proton channel family protein [Halofilum sp. (in: g-proteobacteria)]|nr:MotA/TolQ/ExbB proton channel family protein [Halofilum sp. (in: g-proteobacteria)]